jgi:hypothetical protein
LVIYTAQQWHADWITLIEYQRPEEPAVAPITDDDVPF